MLKNIDPELCGQRAADYFADQYHCAEAIVAAVLEAFDIDATEPISHATPFGGGVGKTYFELCGVLAGGLIVIGHLHGRKAAGAEWSKPARLAQQYRTQLESIHQSCHCGSLREKFGKKAQMNQCRTLLAHGTALLVSLLQAELSSKESPKND